MKEKFLTDSMVTITKADRRNSKEIVDLLLAAWLHTYPNEIFQITEKDLKKKFGDVEEKIIKIDNFLDSSRNSSDITYLVAKMTGNIYGFVYATKLQTELYINSLYVHPEHHRNGIGSLLLQEVITQNHGCNHAIVDVVAYNEKAITFYSKHGFVVQGTSQTAFGKFSNGKIIPEIHMIKNLSDSSTRGA
jgi:ribosomal protein S18 acetylase RimI-like enzyme